MKVSQLIEHLQKLDPEAELIISAPFSCARGFLNIPSTGSLDLPVSGVQHGKFGGTEDGKPWVMIVAPMCGE